jgi:DNA repair exonuclease SbcCD ATPase subunit
METETTTTPPKTITELRAENVKRLKAVEVHPDGAPIVVVGGNNAQGKSSLLDSIAYALGGKGLIPARPVRDGEDEASVEVTLAGSPPLIVRRRWKKDRTTLEVFEDHPTGKAKLSSPQKILDAMCGRIAFDPLAFALMKPADQVATLKEVVGLDTSMIDGQIAAAITDRADINRRVRDIEGELKGMPMPGDDVPDDDVDTALLATKLAAAHEHNNKGAKLTSKQIDLTEEIVRIRDDMVALENSLRTAQSALDDKRAELEETRRLMAEFVTMDPEPIKEQIANASAVNAKVQQKRARHIVETKYKAALAQAEDATARIEGMRQERLEMAENAEWPIPGLDFGESGVMFKGLPFDQASQAEQLRVAVAIGMATNPGIKVLLIRDGSLLDENSMMLLTELATDAGGQVWVERVGKEDGSMVVLEDGQAL